MIQYRPTWAEISRRAFLKNVRFLKRKVGSQVTLLAVLKADGYGHGANEMAPLALRGGATHIGVSSLEEGLSLRQSGVLSPILILGGIYPLKNFEVAFRSNLIPTVASFAAAKSLSKLTHKLNRPISFHLKVDTGMGRIGVSPEEAVKILAWTSKNPEMDITGVYTHLSSADIDAKFTRAQIERLRWLQVESRRFGYSRLKFHAANSAALLRFPQSHLDLVRPGLALYGVSPFGAKNEPGITPVLSWHTKIIFLKKVPTGTPISYCQTFRTKKPSRIATLPVGYGDGVPWQASNKGFVLIKGKRCPVIGRVTMDHIMVDVTQVRASVGDPVVLIGRQGQQSLTAQDWAKWAQTSPYHIICGITKRVPRKLVT